MILTDKPSTFLTKDRRKKNPNKNPRTLLRRTTFFKDSLHMIIEGKSRCVIRQHSIKTPCIKLTTPTVYMMAAREEITYT